MKLTNLRLKDEPLAICIEADGHLWDLHNAFDFAGIHQGIGERSVSLVWRSNGFGVIPSPAPGFEIAFSGVDYFEVTPRDPEIPDFGEDLCLSDLSRVRADDDTRDLIESGVPLWPDFPGEHFHLWFRFRGGQNIRVGAGAAVFRRQPE